MQSRNDGKRDQCLPVNLYALAFNDDFEHVALG